ncbi:MULTISPECIES: GlsB/YeaQ/YmgE family stress response membrane protein [unclassified Exiguobacterium]|uniref:GlsB/YeaQ/YmgE family stress response membrane protein n=1 Tax=unclassified Exiguobacterium TaxID=2644629 RepID=UPI000B58D0D3|nr:MULTISPECIES: GlsB/YeaQ/YmgE family stress response membrane protein [unclassified Exiguobacterium]ASI34662.1 GlsB/YeaQ/YmgE family stress response membrane protein [Exiguobacterium sp. N4-1P]
MGFLWALIVGGLIGWVASLIIGKDVPGGIIGNIVAGFIGSMIGQAIFGDMGPSIGGFAVIPAIIGAIILIFIVSLVLRSVRKR